MMIPVDFQTITTGVGILGASFAYYMSWRAMKTAEKAGKVTNDHGQVETVTTIIATLRAEMERQRDNFERRIADLERENAKLNARETANMDTIRDLEHQNQELNLRLHDKLSASQRMTVLPPSPRPRKPRT